MKYKNIIIKCSNNQELISLQKHLFEYKYVWLDSGIRNRQIKKRDNTCVIINNDDILTLFLTEVNFAPSNYKIINYIKFIRKHKLQKINEISI